MSTAPRLHAARPHLAWLTVTFDNPPINLIDPPMILELEAVVD